MKMKEKKMANSKKTVYVKDGAVNYGGVTNGGKRGGVNPEKNITPMKPVVPPKKHDTSK